MRICSTCGFSKYERFFEGGRTTCIKCRSKARRKKKRDLSNEAWGTASELAFVKTLSRTRTINYYNSMHLRNNWGRINPKVIKKSLEKELNGIL